MTKEEKISKSRLTQLEFHHIGKRYRRYFKYQCSCGNTTICNVSAVNLGDTKSCGCLGKEAKQKFKLPNNGGVINQIILGYKRHAKDRNLLFELSTKEFASIVVKPCHYCGAENSNTKFTKNCKNGFPYNGIDRIDSLIGYVTDNVLPCCKNCNLGKRDMLQADFIAWAKRVAEFNKKEN